MGWALAYYFDLLYFARSYQGCKLKSEVAFVRKKSLFKVWLRLIAMFLFFFRSSFSSTIMRRMMMMIDY